VVRFGGSLSTYEAIWETVRQIPRGKVATYGQIASESGFPRQSRMVGYALHALPVSSNVPWHRVINARGRISFPERGESYNRQKRLLRSEGVTFVRDVVDLERFGWLSDSATADE
jgi:methylated-DNA-protein-cysteine methyltransferase-like protein